MQQPSLEQLPVKEPDLRRISTELEQAATDATEYVERLGRCRGWWHNNWRGQSYDGRKHAEGEAEITLPWEGASDSRLRIVSTLIKEHVKLCKASFRGARVSVRSARPLVYGKVANIAEKVLQWHIYTQMRREVNRELKYAWNWKWGFGLSFMSIEWEQQRVMTEEPIRIEDLLEISQQLGLPEIADLGGGEADDSVIQFLQTLSPILAKDEARKIISDLRNDGSSMIPVVNLVENKPRWTALLPTADLLFPSETNDIQFARFTDRRELVNESELVDRIDTDGYSEDFVDEALKHKGEFAGWLPQQNYRYTATGSERDQIELHHFLHRNVESGIPCMYRTVFNYAVMGKYADLCAVHKVFEYSHQMYPVVALRRTHHFRPLLSAIGLAEEAYTDELDIKVQQDGLTDRTELINSPPMVVPVLRAQGLRSQFGPRAIMPALRPNEVNWPPLPPSDNTPMAVIEMVQARLDRRYSISGPEVDPQMKVISQQDVADETHEELELMLEQTLKLAQQFDTDDVVQRVAGKGDQSWQIGVADILGDYEIAVTMDMRMSDMAYVKEKLQLFQGAMSLNQAGNANMSKIMSRVMNIIDPDAEDLIEEDQASVTERETSEEKNAAAQIMVGIEPVKPMHANHQLRLQTLIGETVQSKNPAIQQTIASRKDIQELLKNRVEFFQNRIQQNQVNPQIGRATSTGTFDRKSAPEVTNTV